MKMTKNNFEFNISDTGDFHARIEDVFVKVAVDIENDPGGTVTIEGECPRCEHWTFSVNSCARKKGLMKHAYEAFVSKMKTSQVEPCDTCKKILIGWAGSIEHVQDIRDQDKR